MANVDDYNQKLEAIKAIPDEETQVPTIPVDVYLQEAENLYHWSRDDQEQLACRDGNFHIVRSFVRVVARWAHCGCYSKRK
ncbi:hypothetical protein [Sunxiuqinia elliptica]|uniref:hypothetical protein n=1 Tax=Sunxiuqinia elliptica TaxID=655355 RepID=UPI00105BAFA4|nr:hypothetical protein [Sunxiuqinia elliptica]